MALSNAAGDTVQTYEYSVHGEVAVEDANHPNPYMFAGVRFDIELGLYYNRARYYNPFTGRFLQTDPIGYKDGMNWYAYCGNNPLNSIDPSGTAKWSMSAVPEGEYYAGEWIRFSVTDDNGKRYVFDACDVDLGLSWLAGLNDIFTDAWMKKQPGWKLSGKDESTFWYLQAINKLGNNCFDYAAMEKANVRMSRQRPSDEGGGPVELVSQMVTCWSTARRWWGGRYRTASVHWAPHTAWDPAAGEGITAPEWFTMDGGDSLGTLAHELQHVEDWLAGCDPSAAGIWSHANAIDTQNMILGALYDLTPKKYKKPRTAYMLPGGNPQGPMPKGGP